MRRLVATALRLRVVVAALAALLLIVGIRTASQTPLDVFPEFSPPLVEIQTEAPGLSTPEVESLVTVPVENALNGVSDLHDAAIEKRPRPVFGGGDFPRRRRPDAGAAARAGAAHDARGAPAVGGESPGHARAALLDEPRDEDRRHVEGPQPGRADHAHPVDRPAAADGVARRGQRRDLGPARSSDPGARGSGAASRARGDARRRDAQRRRRGDSRSGRVHRDTEPAHGRDAPGRGEHGRRPGAGPGGVPGGIVAHARRRGGGHRRLSSPDWGCRHQRRPRPPAHRREAARREHAVGHPGRGGGDRDVPAWPQGRRDRHDDLPARDVHRDVAVEPQPRAPARLRAGHRRAGALPHGMAERLHQHHGHSAVAAGRGARAALPRRDLEHDGARRPRYRPRRGGRRCDHRRREHREALEAEPGRRRAAPGVRRGAGRVARGPQRGGVCHPHRRAGVHPGLLPGGLGRGVLPAARDELRARRRRVAAAWRSSSRRRSA